MSKRWWLAPFVVVLAVGSSGGQALAATFTVTTTADSGAGSLRAAILSANANPGLDTIAFSIGTGSAQIRPTSPLPAITSPVVIDGRTQPGFSNHPLIELSRGGNFQGAGLTITGGGSTVRGLIVAHWYPVGIAISGSGGNVIAGDDIGTNGNAALPNNIGAEISGGSTGNRVGGTTAADRNVISGNGNGVEITGTGTGVNVVEGNYIGTNSSGTSAIGNYFTGVGITGGATGNTVGGTARGAGNLLSGNNGLQGLALEVGGSGNLVLGNWIGTNASGTAGLGNTVGVWLDGTNDTIGGTVAAARNVISGNGQGLNIVGTSNTVEGNYIGTDPAGTAALPNGAAPSNGVGISLSLVAAGNVIGGTTPAARNVISGNADGVQTSIACNSGARNVVEGNYIGTDVTGSAAVANSTAGVLLGDCARAPQVVIIGGTTAGARNLISGNAVGIGQGGSADLVEGNWIGLNASGGGPLGNGVGIAFDGSGGITVGGTAAGARNVISGNKGDGLDMTGAGFDLVEGNFIGLLPTGKGALANGGDGVYLAGKASYNTIGGLTPGARNVISGNAGDGVVITDSKTIRNKVLGNLIGTDNTGVSRVPNRGRDGVLVENGAQHNTIGGAVGGSGNTIAFATNGVEVNGATTTQATIEHNSIFSNSGLGIALTAGGNANQTAPSITSVTTAGGQTMISGTGASPGQRLEIFLDPTCADPEGKKLIDVFTPSSGTGAWTVSVPALAAGQGVTATVTGFNAGSTSQFSSCHAT